MNKILVLLIILLEISSFMVGWFSSNLYHDYNSPQGTVGMSIQHGTSEQIQELTGYGNWICVKVDDMNFSQMVEVCQHEAGHEIFAEIIEKYPKKMDKVMEVLG
jgi:hypothetical protein